LADVLRVVSSIRVWDTERQMAYAYLVSVFKFSITILVIK